jgi:hypothetical protein
MGKRGQHLAILFSFSFSFSLTCNEIIGYLFFRCCWEVMTNQVARSRYSETKPLPPSLPQTSKLQMYNIYLYICWGWIACLIASFSFSHHWNRFGCRTRNPKWSCLAKTREALVVQCSYTCLGLLASAWENSFGCRLCYPSKGWGVCVDCRIKP